MFDGLTDGNPVLGRADLCSSGTDTGTACPGGQCAALSPDAACLAGGKVHEAVVLADRAADAAVVVIVLHLLQRPRGFVVCHC